MYYTSSTTYTKIYNTQKMTKQHNPINFLDLTIHRAERKLVYNIYRKPTATDTMIHQTSCHSKQHKISGINYLINRLHTYPLDENGQKKESNIIRKMLTQNSYPIDTHITQNLQKQQTKNTHLYPDKQTVKENG
jgi:hypothetical protein